LKVHELATPCDRDHGTGQAAPLHLASQCRVKPLKAL
jgi:hypothetical protein